MPAHDDVVDSVIIDVFEDRLRWVTRRDGGLDCAVL
jgi:hypothetical protein